MGNLIDELTEELAKIIHDAGDEILKTVDAKNAKFYQWKDITERMKEVRIIQARFLINQPRVKEILIEIESL